MDDELEVFVDGVMELLEIWEVELAMKGWAWALGLWYHERLQMTVEERFYIFVYCYVEQGLHI